MYRNNSILCNNKTFIDCYSIVVLFAPTFQNGNMFPILKMKACEMMGSQLLVWPKSWRALNGAGDGESFEKDFELLLQHFSKFNFKVTEIKSGK